MTTPPKTCIVMYCMVLLTLLGCKGQDGGARSGANDTPVVVWGPDARSGDGSLDEFIERAVQHSTAGDYEEYRLLWSLDHRPTSRKRFEQIRRAIKQVTVKMVRPIRLRRPDGTLAPQEDPTYVFHSFIEMKQEAKERSNNRLRDRHLVLLIYLEEQNWRFRAAPPAIKDAILDAVAESPATGRPPSDARADSAPRP